MSIDAIEPKIHLIDLESKFVDHGTLCKGAVMGDRAISVSDALNSEMNLRFNCQDCLDVLTNEIFNKNL